MAPQFPNPYFYDGRADEITHLDVSLLESLLDKWQLGDEQARQKIVERFYFDFHRIATRHYRRRGLGDSLRPTALANEAIARIWVAKAPEVRTAAQWWAYVSQVINNLITDELRKKKNSRVHSLHYIGENAYTFTDVNGDTFIAIRYILEALEKKDSSLALVLSLRFFSGLSRDEIATITKTSISSVDQKLRIGKAIIAASMSEE